MKKRARIGFNFAVTFATQHRRLAIGCQTVVIALGCLAVYLNARSADEHRIQLEFNRECAQFRNRLADNLDIYQDVVESIVSLYASSDHVSVNEFRAFVKGPLAEHAGLHALQFIPRVSASTQKPNEQHTEPTSATIARSPLLLRRSESNYGLTTNDGRPANDESPIFLGQPMADVDSSTATDLGANPVHSKAMNLAALSGQPVATGGVRLAEESNPGFALLIPMYGNGQEIDNETARRKHFIGFAAGIFKTSGIVNDALGNRDVSTFRLQITETDNSPFFAFEPEQTVQASLFNFNAACQMAGRNWDLQFASRPEWVNPRRTTFATPYVVSGIVLATLMGCLLHTVSKNTLMIETQVRQRTAELEEANRLICHQRDSLASVKLVLEASNSQLKEFAYAASHDLQAPLRGIANYAEFLKEDYGDTLDDTANEYITRIIASANRMRELILHLLEYSRVESQQLTIQPTDLNRIFEDVVELLEAEIESASAKITCETLPTVNCDAEQMSQLFRNLLGNALKYHSHRPLEIHVAARPGEMWQISIQDNGIGIELQFHSQIFDVFRRLHTQSEYPGTGIGLALCRRIVQRHGGTIFVTSELDKRSQFTFTVPDTLVTKREPTSTFDATPSFAFLGVFRDGAAETKSGGATVDCATLAEGARS